MCSGLSGASMSSYGATEATNVQFAYAMQFDDPPNIVGFPLDGVRLLLLKPESNSAQEAAHTMYQVGPPPHLALLKPYNPSPSRRKNQLLVER